MKNYIEISQEEFSNGRTVRSLGYLGSLEAVEVIRRARSQIGKSYDLLRFNCEHFVHLAHGEKPVSRQLVRGTLIVGLAAVAYILLKKK